MRALLGHLYVLADAIAEARGRERASGRIANPELEGEALPSVHGGEYSFGLAFVQKFPRPDILIDRYLNGETLIEAYWKSVAWPGQGVFIGEPLAAPFRD